MVLAGVLPTPGAAYLSQSRGLPGGGAVGQPQPVPRQRHQVLRPRRPQAQRRGGGPRRGRAGRASSPGGREVTRVQGAAVGTASHRRERAAAVRVPPPRRARRAPPRRPAGRDRLRQRRRRPWPHPGCWPSSGAKVENLDIGAHPDGTNINAGCGSTHPGPLQAEVVATGAAAGLAFDGDADRLVAVDERGGLVDGDHILAIAALDLRARGRLRHDTVVATVMANLGFHQAMAAEGIRVETTPVGDRSVLEAMEAGGFSLGGEQSGHIIFGDLATTGDGLLSGLVLLDVLARSGRPLSELAAVVVKLPQVLRNVRVADRAGLADAAAFWAEVAPSRPMLGRQRPGAGAPVGHRAAGADHGRGRHRGSCRGPHRPPRAHGPRRRPGEIRLTVAAAPRRLPLMGKPGNQAPQAPAPARVRRRDGPHGWELQNSPYTFEGQIEGLGRFGRGVRYASPGDEARGDRRRPAVHPPVRDRRPVLGDRLTDGGAVGTPTACSGGRRSRRVARGDGFRLSFETRVAVGDSPATRSRTPALLGLGRGGDQGRRGHRGGYRRR